MDAEIQAIQRNDTWELVDPPSNCKIVSVKARLVAKGYNQEESIDYREIFTLVTRLETIRTVVALSTFLHGEINEYVYLEQTRDVNIRYTNSKRPYMALNRLLEPSTTS
ncbi:hypothetical protein CR513_29596, partial [Mucuna pruriens]